VYDFATIVEPFIQEGAGIMESGRGLTWHPTGM